MAKGASMWFKLKVADNEKVAHIRLPSVWFRSWSRFFAVSLQVMWVINPALGCCYFPPGLQLPSRPLRGLLPISLLVNRGTMGVNSLPKTVTRQCRGCDLNPGPSAPESITLTTRLSSHLTHSEPRLINDWYYRFVLETCQSLTVTFHCVTLAANICRRELCRRHSRTIGSAKWIVNHWRPCSCCFAGWPISYLRYLTSTDSQW